MDASVRKQAPTSQKSTWSDNPQSKRLISVPQPLILRRDQMTSPMIDPFNQNYRYNGSLVTIEAFIGSHTGSE